MFGKRVFILLLAVCMLGCTMGTSRYPVIPDTKIVLAAGQGGTLSMASIAAIGIAYSVYDPLAPNWEITETRLDEKTYRFDMVMKRFNTGGDGDALMIVKRRARQLQQMSGMGSYKIQTFEQNIDSQTIGARRQVEATIVLIPEIAPAQAQLPLDIFTERPVTMPKVVPKKKVTSKAAAKKIPETKNEAPEVTQAEK
jgi:hypothetical protein